MMKKNNENEWIIMKKNDNGKNEERKWKWYVAKIMNEEIMKIIMKIMKMKSMA